MFNLVRMLNAAQYTFRVSLNLSPVNRVLTDEVRFPNLLPLVRKARIHGFTAKECASLLNIIAREREGEPLESFARDIAINETMKNVISNTNMWKSRA